MAAEVSQVGLFRRTARVYCGIQVSVVDPVMQKWVLTKLQDKVDQLQNTAGAAVPSVSSAPKIKLVKVIDQSCDKEMDTMSEACQSLQGL